MNFICLFSVRPRYGLRTFLLITICATSLLGWVARNCILHHHKQTLVHQVDSVGCIASLSGDHLHIRIPIRKSLNLARLRHILDGSSCFSSIHLSVEYDQLNLPPHPPETFFPDLSPLAGLASVTWYTAVETSQKDLQPIAHFPNLKYLTLSQTKVRDLRPLALLSDLRLLRLYRTEVRDLEPLSGLAKLELLDVSETEVSDLTPIASCSALKELFISGTAVSELAPLAGLIFLENVDIARTLVTDLSPLVHLTDLRLLNLSYAPIKVLTPLFPLRKLEWVGVQDILASEVQMDALRNAVPQCHIDQRVYDENMSR